MQQELGELLENDARVLDRVEHTTAIDRQPHANMHRVAGLAQQHGIGTVIQRCRSGWSRKVVITVRRSLALTGISGRSRPKCSR